MNTKGASAPFFIVILCSFAYYIMKGVRISELIDYLSLEDEEGPLGVMIFNGTPGQPAQVESIEDRDQFNEVYDRFRLYEQYT